MQPLQVACVLTLLGSPASNLIVEIYPKTAHAAEVAEIAASYKPRYTPEGHTLAVAANPTALPTHHSVSTYPTRWSLQVTYVGIDTRQYDTEERLSARHVV